jgi:imidazolonepropionase-like amidohydrolase
LDLLVKAGKVIDGTGAEPIEKGAILISGNTIKEIGRQSELNVESGTQILDAGDKTVIPGLMDCHAHFCGGYHIWTHEKYVAQEITKTILLGVYNASQCVQSGVLTIRDAGCGHTGIFQMRSAINSGQIRGPRLLVSGYPIAMTGGHGWDMAREVDGPDETRKAVRDMLRWGADCIKFMVTGGAATQYEEMDQTQMTLSELTAGVEEAKKKGKRTFAHANYSNGALLCVEAGIDSIDHGNLLDNKALDAIKKGGAFYVPTLYAYVGMATRGKEAGFSDWAVEKCKKILEAHKESFQRAYRMGVNIATGTDLGFEKQASSYGKLGESLITEMEIMVKYGMTPMHAIKAATYMSARNLGIEKSVGTLEKGKLADLVIIDGDPLENISNLRRTWRVMKEGKIVHEA